MIRHSCRLNDNMMETDRKVRVAVNYYRKNAMRIYFEIWKKYAAHKQRCFTEKIQQRNGYLDLKVTIYFFNVIPIPTHISIK